MPQETIRKKASRTAGRRSKGGAAQHQDICRTGSIEGACSVIADSVYSVVLKPKSGAEILFAHGVQAVKELVFDGDGYTLDPYQLYNDLYACYLVAHKSLHPDRAIFDPIQDFELPIYEAMNHLLMSFRLLIPKEFDFNIERTDKGEFFFMVYGQCGTMDGMASMFIGKAIKKLGRTNTKLHDLFVEFLYLLIYKVDITPWWDGMDYAIEAIRDEVEYNNQELDRDDLRKLTKDLNLYITGDAHYYANTIRKAMPRTTEEILALCSAYRKNNPIRQMIEAGCALIDEGFSWRQFEYQSDNPEDYGDVYLRLDLQSLIAWTYRGQVWDWHEDYINTDAQEGVECPIANMPIKKNMSSFDLGRLKSMQQFPEKFDAFFALANKLLNKYE